MVVETMIVVKQTKNKMLLLLINHELLQSVIGCKIVFFHDKIYIKILDHVEQVSAKNSIIYQDAITQE